jgi:hypothetical protein
MKCLKCDKDGNNAVHIHVRKRVGDTPFVSGARGYVCDEHRSHVTIDDLFKDRYAWDDFVSNMKSRLKFTLNKNACTLRFKEI